MSTTARVTLDPARIHPGALQQLSSYQHDLIARVDALALQHDVVIVGMSMNPFPGRARKLLDAQRIGYEYLELGSYLSQWRLRLGLKMWTGWPTFPMIFVKRSFIGGFNELKALVDSGELAKLLAS